MKKHTKFPKVLSYVDWFNLYEMVNNKEIKIPYNSVYEYPETDEMKEKRMSVLESLNKYKKEIIEIEEKMVQYLQLDIIRDPSVYIAILKDSRNPEFENITAKTFWPIVGGGKREIRIYVGRASQLSDIERKNLASSDEVKNSAKSMMKNYLMKNYLFL